MNQLKLSENQFVKSYLNSVNSIDLFGVDSASLEQVGMTGGIPDILMVKNNQLADLTKFINKFPNINLTNGHAKIISNLSYKVFISSDNLITLSGLTNSHFKKSIAILENLNVVEKNRENLYRLRKGFNLPQIDMMSLEFKLDNWRVALRQSLRNRSFSKYVSVVMPYEKKAVLKRNKHIFRRFKVGALVYSPDNGKVEFIVRPVKCGALSKRLYIDSLGRLALSASKFPKTAQV